MSERRNVIPQGVSLPKKMWDELRKLKQETGIPISKQIEIALRWYWNEKRREEVTRAIKEEGVSYGEERS